VDTLARPVLDFHARLAPGRAALDRLLDRMNASRVDRVVISAGGVIPLDQLSRQLTEGGHTDADPDNDAVERAAAQHPRTLIPCYFANPHRPADYYRCRAARFRALEISPAVHGVPLSDPRVQELARIADVHRHPVYLVGLDRDGCRVADLVTLARAHPSVSFVLGHGGVGDLDAYGLDLIAPVPNIFWETSGGYTCITRLAVERLGPGRLVFGTEFPLQDPAVEFARFSCLALPADLWQQIAWRNAHWLLGET
jgi:predicted TIM-barrel fold metal-dependent hydrolase